MAKKVTGFWIKNRSRKWAAPGYSVEFYGFFHIKSNADQAADLLRRINGNTGRYWDTITVVDKPTEGARCLTWQECLSCLGTDKRPYVRLDGKIPISVEAQTALIRQQDMASLGLTS
jgi:hypothetical protein